jgi:hypothetical protein
VDTLGGGRVHGASASATTSLASRPVERFPEESVGKRTPVVLDAMTLLKVGDNPRLTSTSVGVVQLRPVLDSLTAPPPECVIKLT